MPERSKCDQARCNYGQLVKSLDMSRGATHAGYLKDCGQPSDKPRETFWANHGENKWRISPRMQAG